MENSLERRTIQWEAALGERASMASAHATSVQTASAHAGELVSQLQDRCTHVTQRMEAVEAQLHQVGAQQQGAAAAAAAAQGDAQKLRRQLAEAEAAAVVAEADARAACMEAFGVCLGPSLHTASWSISLGPALRHTSPAALRYLHVQFRRPMAVTASLCCSRADHAIIRLTAVLQFRCCDREV